MTKKIFIEIPTWLGDAVMTTPSIENILKIYPDAKLTIFGSFVATKLFVHHPSVEKIVIDDSKKNGNRYKNLYNFAKNMGKFDFAFSYRRNFTTKFLLFFINASNKFYYKRYTKKIIHQVIRYNDFVSKSLNVQCTPQNLKIYTKNETKSNQSKKPILGINPGATYGSAKRWYPLKFAQVIIELSKTYDTIIFGGPLETDIAQDIESILLENDVKNYTNLSGKTSIDELISNISNLDMFVTNDSGPMHVAAAFGVPTVSIFGPTKSNETNQWNNKNGVIVKKDYDCMPCMNRNCHLRGEQNHQCMKNINADDVILKIKDIVKL